MKNFIAKMLIFILYSNVIVAADWFAYVTGERGPTDIIVPINLSNNTAGTSILDIAGNDPRQIAITPDALYAIIVNESSANAFLLDLTSNTILGTASVGPNPFGVAITPDGTTAYITVQGEQTVQALDINSGLVTTAFDFTNIGPNNVPAGIAITPDGTYALIAIGNTGGILSNSIVKLDITTNSATFISNTAIVPSPVNIAIRPDGLTAYVTSQIFDLVSVIDVITNFTIDSISTGIGSGPIDIAITSDGQMAFTSNVNGTVTPINLTNNTAGTNIPISAAGSDGIAITPDHETVYATDEDGFVTPIPISTLSPGTPIFLNGAAGVSIAITPDQAPTASFVASPAPAGSATFFDASNSSSPVGTVVLFEWDFGDGTTATSNSQTISHTYTLPGVYTVTLTVTNSGGTSTTQTFTGRTVSNNGGPSAVTSQQITIEQGTPLPPSDFTGIIKVNKFLNKKECLLKSTWTASPSENVAFYRIFRNGIVVATIPVADPFVFKTCLRGCSANGFEIASVSVAGIESVHVALTMDDQIGSN